MDKIDFAKLISVVTAIAGRQLDYEEIRGVQATLAVPTVGLVDPAVVKTLMHHIHTAASKIEAIKAYRTLTGHPLKESKDAVEAYWPALSEHAP